VYCSTIEHLDLVLNRAGRIPLDLYIDGMYQEDRLGMLELISSRNYSIRSLTVDQLTPLTRNFAHQIIDKLNINALKDLSLIENSQNQATEILNLVTQLDQDLITIKIHSGWTDLVSLLHHRSLRKAHRLEIFNR
jgi:hypothetical protein